MNKKLIINISLCLLFIIILSIGLIYPNSDFSLVGGDSMEPTIEKGCGIIQTENWDQESSLDNEIAIYKPEYAQFETKIPDTNLYIVHRVVAEYESYNHSEADHYISSDNNLIFDNYYVETEMDKESAKELEGEHVLIFEGDNNETIDNSIVHSDQVKYIVDKNNYIKFLDYDQWPCSLIH